ncbi:hypothetical protein ACHAXS_012916 [Conticribra weissflogii]
MTTSTSTPSSTSIHHQHQHQHKHQRALRRRRQPHVIDTESSDLQTATESECAPFFVDLTTLSEGQLDHLRGVGLLPPKPRAAPATMATTTTTTMAATSGMMSAKAADLLGESPSRERDEYDDHDHDDDERIVILEERLGDSQQQRQRQQQGQDEHYLSGISNDPFAIRLLRSRHVEYLTRSLTAPLSKGFVSLDASHPWMVYWILHSLDLLGHFDRGKQKDDEEEEEEAEADTLAKADLLMRVVSTLSHCWSDVPLEFSSREVQLDERLQKLHRCQQQQQQQQKQQQQQQQHQQQSNRREKDDHNNINHKHHSDNLSRHDQEDDKEGSRKVTIVGGGFGGGPSQLPHCAPTYAAVLALSIVAGVGLKNDGYDDDDDDDDDGHSHNNNNNNIHINQSHPNPYRRPGQLARDLLSQKKLPLYAFFLSLRELQRGTHHDQTNDDDDQTNDERTAFRMHHDGEIDVRASYCLLAPCRLLGLLDDDDDDQVEDERDTTPQTTTTHHHHRHPRRRQHHPLLAPSIVRHISACQTHEGGFGAEPYNEAHGGYTFCALASLRILDAVEQIHVDRLKAWLAHRQMGFEGGFCGRTNKLVDGCYSFWQGGAIKLLDEWEAERNIEGERASVNMKEEKNAKGVEGGVGEEEREGNEEENEENTEQSDIGFDEIMLQRYILLCAQDVNGGLRDKPSKPRDFYHTCYNLSGLSVAQHALRPSRANCVGQDTGDDDWRLNRIFGDVTVNIVGRTDPVLNIRVERVEFMLSQTF